MRRDPFQQTYNVGTTGSVSLRVFTGPVGRVSIAQLHCVNDGAGICTHRQTHESRSSDARDIPAEAVHDGIEIRAGVTVLVVVIGPSRHATFDNVFEDNSTPVGSVQGSMVSTGQSASRETGPRDAVGVQYVMYLAVITDISPDRVGAGHEVSGILRDRLGGSVAFILALPLVAGASQPFLSRKNKSFLLIDLLDKRTRVAWRNTPCARDHLTIEDLLHILACAVEIDIIHSFAHGSIVDHGIKSIGAIATGIPRKDCL